MAAVGRSISNIAAAASRAATKLVNGESVACAVARRGELAGDRLAKATIGPRATLDAAAMARKPTNTMLDAAIITALYPGAILIVWVFEELLEWS